MKRTTINALSGLVLAGLGALSPSPAIAQCAEWDVSGKWTLTQGTFLIRIDLQQNGKVVTGDAIHNAKVNAQGQMFGAGQDVTGSVDGTVEGDKFNVQIYWPDNLVGVYRGTIGPQGRVEGITYDKAKPSVNASWYSNRVMKCRSTATIKPSVILKPKPSAPAAATTPPPKVIKSTGKAPTQATKSAAGPSIVAFNKPKQTPGTKTLSWDGGPDHPYAEVWVKVDGQDETFVVEQGKGSREVTVEPGRTYLYILTDSGQQLATVTVRAK